MLIDQIIQLSMVIILALLVFISIYSISPKKEEELEVLVSTDVPVRDYKNKTYSSVEIHDKIKESKDKRDYVDEKKRQRMHDFSENVVLHKKMLTRTENKK